MRAPFDYDVAMSLRTVTIFGVVVSLLGGVSLGVAAFWSTTYYVGETRHERLLLSAAREIQESYVKEVDADDLVDHAIRGMVDALDGHSAFLDDDALIALEEETRGRFGGIGIKVGMLKGYVTVASPMVGTPAARAGIAAGDRLIEVDHRSLKGRTLAEAVRELRGEPGTQVHLRLRREAQVQPLDFDIIRATIASVTGEMLSPGVGYVRIYQFDRPTHTDLQDLVAELKREGPLAGLVLDLRDNRGGLLETAVDIADAFLTSGIIVTIEGRRGQGPQSFHAISDDIAEGAPIVVLINGLSASASEVVAGALQDRGRAIVVGSKSYGKGSVQTVVRLGSRAIKLTTAHYLTPSGRKIQADGVTPDVALPPNQGESEQDYDRRLFETALAELQEITRG